MSAQEIISELTKLSRPELEQVDATLHALLRSNGGTSSKSWGEALQELAGTAQGLPPDFSPSWPARYFEQTAGACADESLERPPQLPFEKREEW